MESRSGQQSRCPWRCPLGSGRRSSKDDDLMWLAPPRAGIDSKWSFRVILLWRRLITLKSFEKPIELFLSVELDLDPSFSCTLKMDPDLGPERPLQPQLGIPHVRIRRARLSCARRLIRRP